MGIQRRDTVITKAVKMDPGRLAPKLLQLKALKRIDGHTKYQEGIKEHERNMKHNMIQSTGNPGYLETISEYTKIQEEEMKMREENFFKKQDKEKKAAGGYIPMPGNPLANRQKKSFNK